VGALRRGKMLADRVELVVGDHRNTRFVGFSAADNLCGMEPSSNDFRQGIRRNPDI